jgi:hypothetical protein
MMTRFSFSQKMGRSKAWRDELSFCCMFAIIVHHGVFLIFIQREKVIPITVGSDHTLLVQSTSCCSVQVDIWWMSIIHSIVLITAHCRGIPALIVVVLNARRAPYGIDARLNTDPSERKRVWW